MPTRKPIAAPTSVRVHRWLAAALVFLVLGGCAQVLGLEEWKPVDCDDPEDPTVCEEQVSCVECLFGAQTCIEAKAACNSDETCMPLLEECTQQACASKPSPVACIRGCCPTMGNQGYNDYVTCLCNACVKECGPSVMGCANSCQPVM